MPRATPQLFTIPAGVPFARSLASGIVDRVGRDPLTLADVLVLLPTRRAARTLHEEFARVLGGAALGPRIRTLGDLDEDELGFAPAADDLELPPAISPLRRRLLLATLVERWAQARGTPLPLSQAVSHAGELARFLDEVTAQGVDLASLKNLVPALYAQHWRNVVAFLAIVAEQWPQFLTDSGMTEPVARRDAILRRYAARLAAVPPAAPIFAAGSTGSIPATADLLKVVAHLPSGAVVLAALDTGLDDASWAALEPGHGQFGLRQLLHAIGAERDDVKVWPAAQAQLRSDERVRFLSEALRPPPTTDRWRALVDERAFGGSTLDGLSLIEAANPREEALVIALALRETLETPERTAALVTPDRGLARRVAAELTRWDIAIDDSAGTKLSRTPPGAFLALLAQAAADDFAPVSLLALLKHPLAGASAAADFRSRVRSMERRILHGLRPAPGLSGIVTALQKKDAETLLLWFAGVSEALQPFAAIMQSENAVLSEIARAHVDAAEALAGARNLWRGESGESASLLMQELFEHAKDIAVRPAQNYAQLFRDLAEMRIVRARYGTQPRIAILGPLEARLQHYDLTILGGLNEGSWPGQAATDPWLSRPLREELGLESPERRIGLAAHDFVTLTAQGGVLLTRALKQDGSPTTASRWLLRLKQLAKGLGLESKLDGSNRLLHWARRIDASPPMPRVPRPEPRPPTEARPRLLRVTEVEKWLRDPYQIYAKYVLRLKPLDEIDVEPGPRERGIAVHSAVERFLTDYPGELPADALRRLCAYGDEELVAAGASPAVLSLWRPRFARAARWLLAYERERRTTIARALVEQSAELKIATPNGEFTLRGRADRIDLMPDGSVQIIDYKTGRAPTQKQIDVLLSPQLPLEGAMAMQGAFSGTVGAPISALIHIRLTGGVPPGEECSFDGDCTGKSLEALERLTRRVMRYYDPAQPYRSRERIERISDTGDYDHLARVREWSLIERPEL